MTTTQTINIQEERRQRVKQALESANLKATNFATRQEELERVYRKFFDEISKKSEHFILEEKDRTEYFSASMFYISDDGVTNYSRPTQIDNIPVNYKEFTIKLKPDVCKASVHIIVDEDIKYGRRGKYKNEGWKIQARIRYNDSPKYKTGGSIVKLVNQQIEQEENQRKHDEMVNERRKKVKDALSERFRFCSYEVISDGKEYSVEIKHGIKLVVSTRINEIGDVEITPKRTEFTSKSLGNVLRGLESM
jgi:hypothetical protein